jgi:DNA (cytosine-5)-methyltransferase 1
MHPTSVDPMQFALWHVPPRGATDLPPSSCRLKPVPTSLELFAGGGGMALGLHFAGFEHTNLVEWEARACDTLRLNAGAPAAPWSIDSVNHADVRDYVSTLAEAVPQDPTLVAGGPPCQPFSLGGVHAGETDRRNMFPIALEVVRLTAPKLVIFENVPGLLRPSFRPYFDYVKDQLGNPTIAPREGEGWQDHWQRVVMKSRRGNCLRYRVARQLILAADLGVPQMRRRVFLIGIRDDLPGAWVPVEQDHSEDALVYDQYISGSYWEEHAEDPEVKRFLRRGLPKSPASLATRVMRLENSGRPSTKRWRTVRDMLRDPELLPEPREGVQRGVWPNHIGVPGARSYPGHTGSDIDLPAKTIKAGVHGVCGGEAMIRWRDGSLRYMTTRESARVQGFPDWYEFSGARSHAMRHIGNAVAVPVARAVGEHLRKLTGV